MRRPTAERTSQMSCGRPPASAIRFSLPCAKKAIERPSGDQNGTRALATVDGAALDRIEPAQPQPPACHRPTSPRTRGGCRRVTPPFRRCRAGTVVPSGGWTEKLTRVAGGGLTIASRRRRRRRAAATASRRRDDAAPRDRAGTRRRWRVSRQVRLDPPQLAQEILRRLPPLVRILGEAGRHEPRRAPAARAAPASASGAGSCSRIAATAARPSEPASNARLPVSISYSTAPKANRSLRASASAPRSCSGAMYGSVPTSALAWRSRDSPGRLGAAARRGQRCRRRARPKSSSFAPDRVSMMLAGLRSRWTMPGRVRGHERLGDVDRDGERLARPGAARA